GLEARCGKAGDALERHPARAHPATGASARSSARVPGAHAARGARGGHHRRPVFDGTLPRAGRTVSTPYIDTIRSPEDLKRLPPEALPGVAEEIRERIVHVVSANGGHLAPSLGTVELTLALHYVLDTPRDILIWDVGHQRYGPKTLTG